MVYYGHVLDTCHVASCGAFMDVFVQSLDL